MTFALAIASAKSAAEWPTSSLMFVAACSKLWLAGRPDTELATPRVGVLFFSFELPLTPLGILIAKGVEEEEEEINAVRKEMQVAFFKPKGAKGEWPEKLNRARESGVREREAIPRVVGRTTPLMLVQGETKALLAGKVRSAERTLIDSGRAKDECFRGWYKGITPDE